MRFRTLIAALQFLLIAEVASAAERAPFPPARAASAPAPPLTKGGQGGFFDLPSVPNAPPSAAAPKTIQPLKCPHVENLFRLTPRIYSGGEPAGDAGFQALKSLGIHTVISVDGAKTDVAAARTSGLRYVHLPIGYDGVPREQALRIIKAVQTAQGPVFIHCHHGKHRGPAAAALACLAISGWDREQALAWLQQAGTSPRYSGLYRTIAEFQPPTGDALQSIPAELPEQAPTSDMVGSMVEIERLWEQLALLADPEESSVEQLTRFETESTAVLLTEQFHELARSEDAKNRGAEFLRMLHAAESGSRELERALASAVGKAADRDRERIKAAYKSVNDACGTCHTRFRD